MMAMKYSTITRRVTTKLVIKFLGEELFLLGFEIFRRCSALRQKARERVIRPDPLNPETVWQGKN